MEKRAEQSLDNSLGLGDHEPNQPAVRKSLRKRIEESIWATPEAKPQKLPDFVQRWLQILDRSFRGFFTNKGPANASALTYTSILTIVPLLAILLAVLKGFGVHETVRDALERLPLVQETRINLGPKTPILPAIAPNAPAPPPESIPPAPEMLTGRQIVDKLYQFVENTNIGNLGVIGVAGLLWAVMSLLSKIEKAMNEAWAVRRSRSWGRKLADYMNMLVISIMMLAALSATATGGIIRFKGLFDYLGFNRAEEILLRYLPYLIVWIAFISMYFYIPNTRVRWKSATISGLIAGTIFQLAQVLFIRTQFIAGRYKIYGVFAIVVIVLAWLYLSWSIVLWGAEVCSAHQNLRDWRRRRRAWRGTPVERETLALRLAALLAAPLLDLSGGKRLDDGDLADTLRLPPGPVGEMIELFQSHGLAIQSNEDGTYLFARSPEAVTLLDILRLVRQDRLEPSSSPPEGMQAQLAQALIPQLKGRTVKDLARMPLDEIRSFTF